MSNTNGILQVLLVEDDVESLKQFVRDLPAVFNKYKIEAEIHSCATFAEALKRAANPLNRYDLIVSDTYKGPIKNRDAQVMKIVTSYKSLSRFCPIVLFSSGPCPAELKTGTFTRWADKGKAGEVEKSIEAILQTGVPQIARELHEDLDRTAGSFLWDFLEKEWDKLSQAGATKRDIVERIIRKRAALKISELDSMETPRPDRDGSEYYIYPSLPGNFCLGDVIIANQGDIRIVLTPHCYLAVHLNQVEPRANFILTVKTVSAATALEDKLDNAKKLVKIEDRHKKLAHWGRSPAQTEAKPEGRHWLLPGFLDIPYCFCDFLQVESVPYATIKKNFKRIATLCPPYAEALQASFLAFYASVGLPDIRPASIESMLK